MSQIVIIKDLVRERETPLAILFTQFYNSEGEMIERDQAWIPDNEIVYRKQEDGYYTIHIPLWLAKKKPFDYEEKD